MPPPKKTRSLAFRLVRGLLVAIAGAYLLIVGAIWHWQAKAIFHPSRIVDTTPLNSGVKFDDVRLPLQGDQLAGWWVPSEDPHSGTLLYLHGNAANVAANLDHVLRLRSAGLNVFIIDYRGYGFSTGGPPREKLLYEDAERAWQYLVAERNIPPAHIAIYGHSLGSAVAIDLASKHPEAGALITEGALTSIADCNASRSFPPTLSRSFPASFSESHAASCALRWERLPKRDRILAGIGRTEVSHGPKDSKGSARQKRPGDFRVLLPKASARELHQRNGTLGLRSNRRNSKRETAA